MMINSANTVEASQTASNENKSDESARDELGKDAFLELLTTQLKHQDPLKPMDNTQFVSQMAQFSSLEQMNNMNDTLGKFLQTQKIADGASLIGKTVESVNEETGEKIQSKVSEISFEDGKVFAKLENGSKVNVDGITRLF
ncbi:MAG: flagellar hook assembly protein FlgD [Bacillota bacterium]